MKAEDVVNESSDTDAEPPVDFRTDPSQYRHWNLSIDGVVATLTMDVNERAGLRPGYRLKLNSYDLGVDIELHDALQRIRFEHPQVRVVVLTSAKGRIFSAGANIYMLAQASHAWKVNFCKFTNETRNGMEDSSRYSGLKFIAACNGTTAGGGYELALACDEIVLVDDRSSSVSLPEVALLGVLPGTGGLTRLIDKRRVRRDHADVLCTTPDGIRGQRALEWRLVDSLARTQEFSARVRERAQALAGTSDRPLTATGIALTPLEREVNDTTILYRHVRVDLDRGRRTATMTVTAPAAIRLLTIDEAQAQGADWWPLAMARELDDAILHLRTNETALGLWLLETRGDSQAVLAIDQFILENQAHWFVREVLGMLRRTLARLDVSSRSLYAVVTEESCFAGTLLELLLAADRGYMRNNEPATAQAYVALSRMNTGALPTVSGVSRLEARALAPEQLTEATARAGERLDAGTAYSLGLVTEIPDSLDWGDELRQAIETRTTLSPDALTGMEASLRFPLPETQATRVFGRLSAWQNWVFSRPNAVGTSGALKVYGTGAPSRFDWHRV
ncbi:MAG TPA: 2,3-epoxybenzoyl-CoA dihydrolase [Vicinamibacterales bacterium]|nr:2,3-epoxybenzoyl-CoA dihydrolase [Vicinamibacterales bacterium]